MTDIDNVARAEVRATIANIIRTMLKRDIADDENVIRGDEPKWDSLMHVEMLFVIEDGCNVVFSPESSEKLDSLDAIVDEVVRLQSA